MMRLTDLLIIVVLGCKETLPFRKTFDLDRNITVCRTSACYDAADRILSYMDRNVKPCDNFYGFACGNFMKNKVVPPELDELSVFTIAGKTVESQLRTILEEDPNNKDLPHELYLKHLYYLCMSEGQINGRGVIPILNMIERLGGWPVLGNVKGPALFSWVAEGWDPIDLEVKIEKVTIGEGCLMRINTLMDLRDKNLLKPRLITMFQPSLGLEREYLIQGPDQPTVKEYFRYMVDIAVIVGANRATAEQQLRDSLAFEIELAKILIPAEERDFEHGFSNFTIEELMKHPQLGWLDWAKYLSEMLPPIVREFPNRIVIADPKYFTKLGILLQQSSPEAVANFMMWRAIMDVLHFMSSRMVRRKDEFYAATTGKKQVKHRWQKCVDDVSKLLPQAMSPMYLKKYFDPEIRIKAEEMVDRITEEMMSSIQKEEWMLFWSKMLAKLKMLTMKRWIGYPPQLLDSSEMNKYFENFTMNTEHYLEAALDVKKFISYQHWGLLNEQKTIFREDWREHINIFQIEACHNHVQNAIEFPYAMLMPPFFSPGVPSYLNFAAIGNVIAHEITHGFDDKGRHFNHMGLLEEWYDEGTKKEFDQRKQCFIYQYGNFTDSTTNIKVDGVRTLGENIADSGGLKFTFHAYSNEYKTEPSLPGLEHLNNKQLFLLALGNIWCTKRRPEALHMFLTTDPHTSEEFRVNGMMMNLEAFGPLFSCPVGTPMNPEKKCILW